MLAIKVFGVQDCLNAFRDLPRTVRNKHMRIGLNAAGGVIRNAMMAGAPKETGLLKRAIKVKVKVPDASHNPLHHGRPAYAVIGPARRIASAVTVTAKGRWRAVSRSSAINAAFRGRTVQRRRPSRYAHFIEKGTKAHGIVAQRASVLSSGSQVFGRRIKHPGVKGAGFMQKAVSTSGAAAQAKMVAKIYEGIVDWSRARASREMRRVGSP